MNKGKATLDFSTQTDPLNTSFTGSSISQQVGPGGSTGVSLMLSLPKPGEYKTVVRLAGNIYPSGYVDVPITVTWKRPTPPPPPPPAAPAFSASPPSMNFGDVVVGFPTDYRPVEITNTGNAPMTIPAGGVTVDPATSNFDFTPGTCDDVTLQPAASCTAEVLYAPQTLGAHTADLQVITNAAGSPPPNPFVGDRSRTCAVVRP